MWAYAGTALPPLLVVAAGPRPLTAVLNREYIVQEVVRNAVGTIGRVASVTVVADRRRDRTTASTMPPAGTSVGVVAVGTATVLHHGGVLSGNLGSAAWSGHVVRATGHTHPLHHGATDRRRGSRRC